MVSRALGWGLDRGHVAWSALGVVRLQGLSLSGFLSHQGSDRLNTNSLVMHCFSSRIPEGPLVVRKSLGFRLGPQSFNPSLDTLTQSTDRPRVGCLCLCFPRNKALYCCSVFLRGTSVTIVGPGCVGNQSSGIPLLQVPRPEMGRGREVDVERRNFCFFSCKTRGPFLF